MPVVRIGKHESVDAPRAGDCAIVWHRGSHERDGVLGLEALLKGFSASSLNELGLIWSLHRTRTPVTARVMKQSRRE